MSREYMNHQQKTTPNNTNLAPANSEEQPMMKISSPDMITQITAMQRTVGNQAVMRYLNGQQNVVQRVDTGIARSSSMTGFAGKAATWAKANGTKTLAEFATQLVTYVNIELSKSGVPNVTADLNAAPGTLGEFDFTPWTLQMNPGSFSSRAGVTTVADLNNNETGEIANTVYHESRHAEQWFRMARLLAGEGKKANAIKTETGIESSRVLRAAESDPLSDPGSSASQIKQDIFKEAKAWQKSVYGLDATYRGLMFDIGDTASTLSSLLGQVTDTPSFTANSAAIQNEVDELKNTHLPDLQSEKLRLEAITTRSSVENTMLTHIDEHIRLIGEIDTEWSAATDETDIPDVQTEVDSLNSENYDAYHDLPEEDDAHDVGDAAGIETESKL